MRDYVLPRGTQSLISIASPVRSVLAAGVPVMLPLFPATLLVFAGLSPWMITIMIDLPPSSRRRLETGVKELRSKEQARLRVAIIA